MRAGEDLRGFGVVCIGRDCWPRRVSPRRDLDIRWTTSLVSIRGACTRVLLPSGGIRYFKPIMGLPSGPGTRTDAERQSSTAYELLDVVWRGEAGSVSVVPHNVSSYTRT